jgi:hypothetical protein
MWRNLSKVTSTIEKIGQAVAPPLESDEEEDSEGSYYEEEEDAVADNQHRLLQLRMILEPNNHRPFAKAFRSPLALPSTSF